MRIDLSKIMKQTLALLAVFVLFQTEVKPHGIPETPIKRGAFTTSDGCKSSALAWAGRFSWVKAKKFLS